MPLSKLCTQGLALPTLPLLQPLIQHTQKLHITHQPPGRAIHKSWRNLPCKALYAQFWREKLQKIHKKIYIFIKRKLHKLLRRRGIEPLHSGAFNYLQLMKFYRIQRKGVYKLRHLQQLLSALSGQAYYKMGALHNAPLCRSPQSLLRLTEGMATVNALESLVIAGLYTLFYYHNMLAGELLMVVQLLLIHTVRPCSNYNPLYLRVLQRLPIELLQPLKRGVGI